MRRSAALLAFGIAAGILAELAVAPRLDPVRAVLDATVGWAFIGAGFVAWRRRPASHVGLLTLATGFAWFFANVVPAAVLMHRALLVHGFVTYPTGRIRGLRTTALVGGAYVLAIAAPLAGPVVASTTFGVLFLAIGLSLSRTRKAIRRSRVAPSIAAISMGTLLVVGTLARQAGSQIDLATIYDLVLVAVAVGLTADLIWGGWEEGLITRFIVDLGDSASAGTVRDRLARAVGDPSIILGYPTSGGRYVDESGVPVALPSPASGRVVTPLVVDGRDAGLIVHDPAVLNDAGLVGLVAASTELVRSNADLQAAILSRAQEVERSRARLVAASDAERARIEAAIRSGPSTHLNRARGLLESALNGSEDDPALAALVGEVDVANAQLLEFARGVDPLADIGLDRALRELVAHSTIPTALELDLGLPAEPVIDTTTYYICSEGLVNAAKHSRADRVRLAIETGNGARRISIVDDGIGGASPRPGGGLSGLIDRVEALGGRLTIDRSTTGGTRLEAAIPYRPRRTEPVEERVA